MALIKQEIDELRDLLKKYNNKEVSSDEVHVNIEIYSQIEKRMRLAIQGAVIGVKHGKFAEDLLVETNLIGSSVDVIDTVDAFEKEKLKNPCLDCEMRDKDKNNSKCKDCEDRISYVNAITHDEHETLGT
ncbi:MAG: hypothetical protein FVQ80_06925 [Planctomycetes bacterium]|nr:hypothetical protein [Planctomycetota bacterium]